MQTQTSNTLHNAIMEASSKDRLLMLAPSNYVQWKSRIKRYIDTKPNHELIHYCLENPPYELGWKDKKVSDADGNLTTTIERGESINVQDLETNLYWEFRKFTSHDGESLESYYSRFYKIMNELIRNQCKVTNHQVNVQFLLQLQPEWQRSQQAATRNKGKAIVNPPQPIYDQEPYMVDDDDETSKDKEIDKLMALISLSFKKIYKPTNNNLRTSSNTSRANQDNSPRINRNVRYKSQRSGNVVGVRETVGNVRNLNGQRMQLIIGKRCYFVSRRKLAEQVDWKDDTDDESDNQELEAHYMYMAKTQEAFPDAVDSGPIFNTEPEQKVQNYDHYDVFAIECQHLEQSESVHETYPIEQDVHNVIIESMDMNYDSEQIDQNDEDVDLAKEPGSKDRPPMLAPGNYIQWKSRIKRYIDTKPNRELIHFCLTNPPYELGWNNKPVLDSEGNPTSATARVFETYKNVEQEIRDQLNAEAEAVQIILTGIDNDIYSTVDACPNACEMWKAIERLKQGESINVRDLETNLFWELERLRHWMENRLNHIIQGSISC
nr:Gag-Pol polyprotein [Tanacetum cinerariifolium]